MKSKKVTIHLPSELVREANKAALDADTTLAEMIESSLREALARRRNDKPRREFKWITYGHGGLHPGVNVDNSSDLLHIMEPPDELRKKFLG